MKVKVVVEVEAPEGATHYTGWLPTEATWWKSRPIAGFPQWLSWNPVSREWYVQGDHPPHFIQEIPS